MRRIPHLIRLVLPALVLSLAGHSTGQIKGRLPNYKVLPPATQDNLMVFSVIADSVFDTSQFLTLDEGIRSGKVVVTETGGTTGLVRPRPLSDGVWRQSIPYPTPPRNPLPQPGAQVNRLMLINNSDQPLLLLAGEIVTGGKQDRIVGRDRIVPAHSEPVALDVFCIEPHRWMGASAQFGTGASTLVQPSVRFKALAEANQQEVWSAVAKSRAAFAAAVPAPQALAIESSSSYAAAVQSGGISRQLDSIAAPIERSYENLMHQLRAQKAVGAVVAVNGEIIWADVFASPALLDKYWLKLIRSYAAEALAPRILPTKSKIPPTQLTAQNFLDRLDANHENVETEPDVYRNTELHGDDFDAFLLTSLLPNTGFPLHLAKMQR